MKIAIAQINPTVGDLSNNCQKILNYCQKAEELAADLVVFPELSLLGYPPKDLLLRMDFLEAQTPFLQKIAATTRVPAIVGAALLRDKHHLPFNAAILCFEGKLLTVAKKVLLPNYNVFDEKRYFSTPDELACQIFSIGKTKLLLSICEDAWNSIPLDGELKYDIDPIKNGIDNFGPVDVILNISASPFTKSKPKIRERIFSHLAVTYQTPVLVCGQVGANDQLLFDGHSLIIDKTGQIIKRAQPCVEDLLIFDLKKPPPASCINNALDEDQLLLEILTLGIRDYLSKCKLPGVFIGLSGGIDSAVCAALAVKALGHERVRALYLPSQYSSEQSMLDAQALAKRLSIRLDTLSIEESAQVLRRLLAKDFQKSRADNADIADQNIQARLRGLIIMELANMTDFVMMATSNKSELAVGYSTTYGDMCGAFSAIGDLYKTEVYRLANTINKSELIIPQSIIDRPPTAELKPNQLDTDSLPKYDILDKILFNFIELEKSAQEIYELTGLPKTLINQVIGMVSLSEYKRRQGPFCLMVSDKVFGDARRLPIAKNLTI